VVWNPIELKTSGYVRQTAHQRRHHPLAAFIHEARDAAHFAHSVAAALVR
jgi:hypothetical protein